MNIKSRKALGYLAVAGMAMTFSTASHADNWHNDWWENGDKHIFKEVTMPEKCVEVLDPITVGNPKLGDFCYEAEGNQFVRERNGKTTIKFEGQGKAVLWEDKSTRTYQIGKTHFRLSTKTVFNSSDTIKKYTMAFDSNQFKVQNSSDECRRISVEMNFTGQNQIGGTETDPIFDITQGTDEIVVTPCSHSNHGFD